MSRIGLGTGAMLGTSALAMLGWLLPSLDRDRSLRLPGTVEVQEVRLGPRVAGRVERVEVAEGEVVEPGRVILRLDVPELVQQRDRRKAGLAAAEAAFAKVQAGPRAEEKAAARAELLAAEARLARLRAGARPEELAQARRELESAEADLRIALSDWQRIASLFERGFGSDAERDDARGQRDRHQGHVGAARAHLDLLLAGSRKEDIDEAEAMVQQARARLDLLLAGSRKEDIDEARARVDEARFILREAEIQLGEAVVLAPERAVVEVVAVRAGDLVQAGQPVVRVLRASDLWVKVFVPETDLGKIRLDQHVAVTTDSYPGIRLQGRVVQIASISEFTPRNVQSADERRHQVFAVKVRVDDPQGVFKSGMAANVVLPLHEATDSRSSTTDATDGRDRKAQ